MGVCGLFVYKVENMHLSLGLALLAACAIAAGADSCTEYGFFHKDAEGNQGYKSIAHVKTWQDCGSLCYNDKDCHHWDWKFFCTNLETCNGGFCHLCDHSHSIRVPFRYSLTGHSSCPGRVGK